MSGRLRIPFAGWLSWRYAFSRSNRHRTASFVIMLGIAVGMAAIITILSLMDSLQADLLDQIKSVESFHLQVENVTGGSTSQTVTQIVELLEELPFVESVVPFIDTKILVQNRSSNRSTTARLRVIPEKFWQMDTPFKHQLVSIAGNPPSEVSISLGYYLYSSLASRIGDNLDITLLRPGKTAVLAPFTLSVTLGGLFQTGLSDFDSNTVFADYSAFSAVVEADKVVLGLYLDEQHMDNSQIVIESIKERLPEARVKTWQQLNNAFYSALMLEKTIMYLFLFFMFIIIGVNIKNATSRLLFVKKREVAILRAIGAERRMTSSVFILQALMIAAAGQTVGIATGLAISTNIGKILPWLNDVQYHITHKNSPLLMYPFKTTVDGWEILAVVLFVFSITVFFAFIGSHRLLKKEPMEILYHE